MDNTDREVEIVYVSSEANRCSLMHMLLYYGPVYFGAYIFNMYVKLTFE